MSDYRSAAVDKYVGDLASNMPAPGGGSGAALAGALGNALGAMVGNFTVGKEKFADVQDDVVDILRKLEAQRERLLQLVDEDVAVYGKVSAAYKLPKATDEEKADRSAAIEAACKAAAGVPRAIAEACDRTIELSAKMCDIGNPNLISDVGCAVRLAEAARHCAWLNVAINLSFIKDDEFKQEMTEALEEPGRESHRLAEETWKKVVKAVCG
ncbi:MAG TPA: cyclodeaminase/cyclohydrolase family protein [Armatimonadota bacterium]|jgi:formiminotetrahydrofolate cyclodeaminase|nr:cyclodeaminase/cyclohydrolase family protein [Armatimonadota bacterium]